LRNPYAIEIVLNLSKLSTFRIFSPGIIYYFINLFFQKGTKDRKTTIKTAELLFLDGNSGWVEGPSPPLETYGSSMIEFQVGIKVSTVKAR
jgi:hypothetical protein